MVLAQNTRKVFLSRLYTQGIVKNTRTECKYNYGAKCLKWNTHGTPPSSENSSDFCKVKKESNAR